MIKKPDMPKGKTFNVTLGSSRYNPQTKTGVELGDDSRLAYAEDPQGNRMPDFSHVGYHAGEKDIPEAVVVETLSPADGDDTARIQAAIDRVGALEPGSDGLRGAILLKRGLYHVEGTLKILSSGVILRGEGCGHDGTVIVAAGYEKTDHRHDLIIVGNDEKVELDESSKQAITDSYVPVGTHSFSVESTAGYAVGDRIILYRPSTANWITDIGMDTLRPKFKEKNGEMVEVTRQWKAGEYDYYFKRRIIDIDGNRITIDVPMMHSLDAQYGGGAIYHYHTPSRVFEVGIEDIHLVSEFGEPIDGNPYGDPEMIPTSYENSVEKPNCESHSWHAIRFAKNSENGWVRRVSGNYFCRSLVNLEGSRVTVQDCVNIGHASEITGGRRYPFVTTGQMNLFQRCVTRYSRHEFVTNARATGPNVFVDCSGVDCVAVSGCGPHGRYAIGILFDNVRSESQMESTDYDNRGSGHGWGGAQIAFYNCIAPKFFVTAPIGATCWVIGDGNVDDPVPRQVEPRSLYHKQLEDRLGKEAIDRMTIEAQRNGTIYELLEQRLDEQVQKHP